MAEYRKLTFQPPKSYDELNKNRPTKRKNYNYTGQVQTDSQTIKIPLSNVNPLVSKDFSFDNGENIQQKKSINKSINPLSSQQEFSPINYKFSQNVQSESQNESNKIDERLNNISSIKDKINGLLNSNRTQNRSAYNTPLTQKTRNIQTTNKQKNTEAFSSKIQSEAAYSSTRQEKNFKSKYSYIPNQRLIIEKAPIDPKKYQIQLKKIDEQNVVKTPIRIQQPLVRCKFEGDDYVVKQYKKMYQYGPQQEINNKGQNKIKELFQNRLEQSRKKQSYLTKNIQLDRKISALKNKILIETPPSLKLQYENAKDTTQEDIPQLTQNVQISKLAKNLSKIVEMDIMILKLRQKFQKWNQPNKWNQLKSQLKSRGVSLQQKELKQIFQISIHEKNPFGSKNCEYTLNGVKDLAKLYAEAEQEWTVQIDKNISLDSLAQQRFSMAMIDMNSRGTINLEDLVCFINLNSKKFYRSRDVAPLFKRLLKIEGKTIDKNIGVGLTYGTFMDKLAK